MSTNTTDNNTNPSRPEPKKCAFCETLIESYRQTITDHKIKEDWGLDFTWTFPLEKCGSKSSSLCRNDAFYCNDCRTDYYAIDDKLQKRVVSHCAYCLSTLSIAFEHGALKEAKKNLKKCEFDLKNKERWKQIADRKSWKLNKFDYQ